jgi:hypothetical protein
VEIYLCSPICPYCVDKDNLLLVLFNYLWLSNNDMRCSDTTTSDNGMISEKCSGDSLEVTMPSIKAPSGDLPEAVKKPTKR